MLANGWVITIIGLLVPLTNGGAAGAVWTYVLAIIGSFFGKAISSSPTHRTTEPTSPGTLSLAEMASMAPTA
jgi:hypothetical protein